MTTHWQPTYPMDNALSSWLEHASAKVPPRETAGWNVSIISCGIFLKLWICHGFIILHERPPVKTSVVSPKRMRPTLTKSFCSAWPPPLEDRSRLPTGEPEGWPSSWSSSGPCSCSRPSSLMRPGAIHLKMEKVEEVLGGEVLCLQRYRKGANIRRHFSQVCGLDDSVPGVDFPRSYLHCHRSTLWRGLIFISTVISVIMQRPNFYRNYATPIFDSSFLLILS